MKEHQRKVRAMKRMRNIERELYPDDSPIDLEEIPNTLYWYSIFSRMKKEDLRLISNHNEHPNIIGYIEAIDTAYMEKVLELN